MLECIAPFGDEEHFDTDRRGVHDGRNRVTQRRGEGEDCNRVHSAIPIRRGDIANLKDVKPSPWARRRRELGHLSKDKRAYVRLGRKVGYLVMPRLGARVTEASKFRLRD